MTNTLLEKLRKSRQTNVQAGGFTFTVRRLNDFDIGEITQTGHWINAKSLLKRCVVDWPGMTEIMLDIPGGTSVAVPFDQELFIEWVADKKSVWSPLQELIWQQYKDSGAALDNAAGESSAGLSQANLQPASPDLTRTNNLSS